MKRFVSLTLALLFAITLLGACGGTGNPSQTETPSAVTTHAGTDEIPVGDTEDYVKDALFYNPVNFGGDTVTLLYWSDREHEEFVSDGENGELINDSIFQRNANVEERLGITIKFEGTKGNASNVGDFATVVQNSVKGGNHDYDLIGAHSITAGNLAVLGLLYDLKTCQYLDWEKPWWPASLIEDATINGRLFFASGDISANTIYMMYVTFFNKQMLEDFNLEDPYKLVDAGTWTIDKMFEMSKGIYSDINVSGSADIGDLYGQYAYTLHLDAFLTGAGVVCVDASGEELKFSEDFLGEKTTDLAAKLKTYFGQNDTAFLLTKNESVHMHFNDNRSLFWNDRCRNSATFKQNDVSFGVIPNPKYSTDQENYCTVLGNPFSIYGTLCDSRNPDMMAAFLEVYASESYRRVSPALYDITLKYRYTDDAVSSRMFDLVRSGVIFDLGRIFATGLKGPYTTFENCIAGGTSWATVVSANQKIWKNGLKTVLKSFD